MIVHHVEQRTPEWLALRLGVVTSSGVDRIITPAGLKPSKQADAYLAELTAEVVLGRPLDTTESKWMTRGTEMEEDALAACAWAVDADIDPGGFITTDDGRCGCSPDGLIAETVAGVEVKCHGAKAHSFFYLYADRFEAEHRMQVQFSLWVAREIPLWFLFGYCADKNKGVGLPSILREIRPDPKVFAAFDEHVPPFLKRLDEAVARMREMAGAATENDNPFV